MSWNNINNSELQAMRKLLMLDVAEAAELIGKVSARSWQYWESGKTPVPADVDEEIYSLIQIRNDRINDLSKWQLDNDGETLEMDYYHAFDLFEAENPGKSKLDWRLHQSVVSFIFSEGGEVKLRQSGI